MKVKRNAAKALSFVLAATMVLTSGSMAFADTGGEAEPVVMTEDAAQPPDDPAPSEPAASAGKEDPAAEATTAKAETSVPAERPSQTTPDATSPGSPTGSAPQPAQENSGIAVQSIEVAEPALVTYEFYANGKKISTQTVKNGDSLRVPEATFIEGSKFTGWMIGETPFTSFGRQSGITQTATVRVDAHYETICYVYFLDGTGSDARVIRTKEGLPGTAVNTSDVSFATGAEESITGWYTDASLSKNAEGVTFAESDIYLYPKVEKGFWITFRSGGGTCITPVFYRAEATASAPDAPARAGYTFTGWYLDQELSRTADFQAIHENTTLYAGWAPAKNTRYTVIHWLENADDDHYSSGEIERRTGTTGEKTAASANALKGFTPQKITQKEIAGDGSTIVNVYYKRNIYEVKFYSRNGRTEYATLKITAKYGANIRDRWPEYNGSSTWAVKPSQSSDFSGPFQSGLELMPLNGATFYGPKIAAGTETASYYVEALPGQTGTETSERISYVLHHRDTSPGTGYVITKEDKYPITGFTYHHGPRNGSSYNNAKFYYSRNSYDIVFVNNGVKEKNITRKYQQNISDAAYIPAPPSGKEDWHFDGWYDNEPGQGEAYAFRGKAMPAQNITLYAKWSAPSFTVTAHGRTEESVKVVKGGQVSEEDFDCAKPALADGERWMGWALRSGSAGDYTYTPFSYSTEITRDYDLYPYIVNAAAFTVTYDAGEGSGTVPSDPGSYAKDSKARIKSRGSRLAAPAGAPHFLGWKSSTDGRIYQPGDRIIITGNTVLTAQWGEDETETSVIYRAGEGASGDDKSFALPNNGAHVVLDVTAGSIGFTKNGYHFTGWQYTDKNGNAAIAAPGQMIWLDADDPQPNVLTAQWEADPQPVDPDDPQPVIPDEPQDPGDPKTPVSPAPAGGSDGLQSSQAVLYHTAKTGDDANAAAAALLALLATGGMAAAGFHRRRKEQ